MLTKKLVPDAACPVCGHTLGALLVGTSTGRVVLSDEEAQALWRKLSHEGFGYGEDAQLLRAVLRRCSQRTP